MTSRKLLEAAALELRMRLENRSVEIYSGTDSVYLEIDHDSHPHNAHYSWFVFYSDRPGILYHHKPRGGYYEIPRPESVKALVNVIHLEYLRYASE